MSSVHEKIIRLLSEMTIIEDTDRDIIVRSFEPVSYPKRTILGKENSIVKYMYFINSGYLRTYYFRDGIEITNNINCPLGFMTAYTSYASQKPSQEILECITDCDLLRIEKHRLDTLFSQDPKWSEIGRIVNERIALYNEERARRMVSTSARQRYLNLITEHPDYVQNVPVQYIASFIGIKPESLSRIRKAISND